VLQRYGNFSKPTKNLLEIVTYGVTPALDELYFKSLDGGRDTFSVIPYGTRGLEISEWLRTHPQKQGIPYSYAILDDGDDFLLTQSERVVITEPETGLTKELAERVIEILNKHSIII
jgi:hypothetical protein